MNSVAAVPPPALVLVGDHRLRDEVRRIAAAADRCLDERSMPVGRHAWAAAALVIIDLGAARTCAAAGYPRRSGVVLVGSGEPDLDHWQAAAAVGAEQVIALPSATETLIEAFAAYAWRDPGDGLVLAVVGAGGGAGASVFAATLALAAAARRFRPRILLVDGDPLGGGIDLLLGIESAPGLRWPDLSVEDGRVAAQALHDALPTAAPGLGVLACSRPAGSGPDDIGTGAARAVVEAGRGAGDLVVCDISGSRGPHTDHLLDAADLVVFVVPARLRAVAAAGAAVADIRRRNPNQALVVRGPAPGGLRGRDIAEALGLPLLAAMRAQPGLAADLERGGLTLSRGPLAAGAESVLSALPEGAR
ncbi:septum site-determining protein Ssd [Nocardia africana]|uniref:Septum site-determining protein Ssd n=1 Tax=Nocardia africana TaxID=134964 RepID=A0ABW6N9L5_9NOCA